METTAEFQCAYCGEVNTTFVDLSAGYSQRYTEDCQVCCHPNVLAVWIDEDSLETQITTEFEG